MLTPHTRVRPPARLRWPRRTARLRFTALYTGLFLLSGAALMAITYLLFQQATQYKQPHLPQIPNTPAIQALQLPQKTQLPQALSKLAQDQYQLAQAQQQLTPPDPARLIQYVNCVRAHGIPNYPSPTGNTTNFNGTGVDPTSHQVENVSTLCGHNLNLPACGSTARVRRDRHRPLWRTPCPC
jgi:hypothetical protein